MTWPLLLLALAAAPDQGVAVDAGLAPDAKATKTDETAEAERFADLEASLTHHTQERYAADLAEIKRRGVLRVLTRNSSVTYFLHPGAQQGYEYELAKAFADHLGVRLAIVVPSSRDALMEALLQGRGDMIAAGMSLAPARAEKVLFTRPIFEAQRVVATHSLEERPLKELSDLVPFKLHVDFSSTTLRDLRAVESKLGRRLKIENVADGVEMEEMLQRVSDGSYEATVADRRLVQLAKAGGVDVEERLAVGDKRKKAWAFHPGSTNLKAVADRFLKRNFRLAAIFEARYFRPRSKNARRAQEAEFRADQEGKLSPFDDLFRKVGKEAGLDWRLLAAVAYSESRFNPKAASAWGARGLMQVLPNTARSVGVRGDLLRPINSIRAGARYLGRLARRFEDEGVTKRQRIRFALAAYNAGLGHILDARRLAVKIDKDPNRWFGNVARALALKADRRWHEQTRHGYARAGETLSYVSRIQSRYDVYVRHVPLEPGEAD